MKPASVDKIIEKDAKHLLVSTDRVNFNGLFALNSSTRNSGNVCQFLSACDIENLSYFVIQFFKEDSRTTAVNCCDVTSEIVYPLFGFSLSSSSMVRIVQEQLQQAVVYRRCQ